MIFVIILQLKIVRVCTIVLSFINNLNLVRHFEVVRKIYSKLVEKFVNIDKTRIWGTWDTLYMCAYIWILLRGVDCSVILLTIILSWYDAWSAHFHIVLYTVYSRNRRTRESPKRKSVSCGSCLLSRRGSTSLSDVHYVRL